MSSEAFELATTPMHPRIPSPIDSNDSDQSNIIRLPARPGSRLTASISPSVAPSTENVNKLVTEHPSHFQLPFKFSINEDQFLQDLPTPIPR